ncbi:MAG: type VI secretion system ATPase TssH [Deltaproteobacteria bacterium]|jgi:type VI secretion system protein VasG|nr:type VI secretion system ATPase TssH [Deltaproteobacteria bacterium]
MVSLDIKRLLDKCDNFCTQALYDAAGLAVDRTHYEVAAEHFLLKCLESKNADAAVLLERYGLDRPEAIRGFTRALDAFKSGNSARPGFSPMLIDLLETAWLVSSVDLRQTSIRSGAALLAYAGRPAYYSQSAQAPSLSGINRDEATRNFLVLTEHSSENAPPAGSGADAADAALPPDGTAQGFVAQFCEDFTAKARAGKIDTVFGRDAEIRSVLTILARRRKNNPILVGEPGVGKTAVIEGLAKRIVEGDVPESLNGVTLLSLDLGLLEAGAGMKGEFERRLKGVIDEIKGSPKPIILFIDEAHMLVGAGGQAGGSDAANLLKPALARGELRTCAATTWKEYKKYFEKDPALARRFQPVSLEEPDTASAVLILRGLRESYEKAHAVVVRDDAITSAVELSSRFITGRFLPDKAIDLMDTACAKVKMSLSTKPPELEDTERGGQALLRELDALERDAANGAPVDEEKMTALRGEIAGAQQKALDLTARWEKERAAALILVSARSAYADAVRTLKSADAGSAPPLEENPRTEESGSAGSAPSLEENPRTDPPPDVPPDVPALKNALDEARSAYTEVQGEAPLTCIEVTPDVVAQVVSDWTGIPVGKVAREQASLVAELDSRLEERIKGQDAAIASISKVIKASKAGLCPPGAPIGTFLLVGPSGVGKTETGLALADLLFGDEESAITINMSEFQERHTVSRLIGSPPGYVGYGEGGLLTEAVRKRPYSVILLDEVEKAHPDVMNLFYQVFDKGELTDSEGKKVGFGSTVILLTSNIGSEKVRDATLKDPPADAEELKALLWQDLCAHFKPALLARMAIVPYAALSPEALTGIARMKLDALAARLQAGSKTSLRYSDALVRTLVDRCREVDTGARNIDHILTANVLPKLAQILLEKMSEKEAPAAEIHLDVDENSEFTLEFADAARVAP